MTDKTSERDEIELPDEAAEFSFEPKAIGQKCLEKGIPIGVAGRFVGFSLKKRSLKFSENEVEAFGDFLDVILGDMEREGMTPADVSSFVAKIFLVDNGNTSKNAFPNALFFHLGKRGDTRAVIALENILRYQNARQHSPMTPQAPQLDSRPIPILAPVFEAVGAEVNMQLKNKLLSKNSDEVWGQEEVNGLFSLVTTKRGLHPMSIKYQGPGVTINVISELYEFFCLCSGTEKDRSIFNGADITELVLLESGAPRLEKTAERNVFNFVFWPKSASPENNAKMNKDELFEALEDLSSKREPIDWADADTPAPDVFRSLIESATLRGDGGFEVEIDDIEVPDPADFEHAPPSVVAAFEVDAAGMASAIEKGTELVLMPSSEGLSQDSETERATLAKRTALDAQAARSEPGFSERTPDEVPTDPNIATFVDLPPPPLKNRPPPPPSISIIPPNAVPILPEGRAVAEESAAAHSEQTTINTFFNQPKVEAWHDEDRKNAKELEEAQRRETMSAVRWIISSVIFVGTGVVVALHYAGDYAGVSPSNPVVIAPGGISPAADQPDASILDALARLENTATAHESPPPFVLDAGFADALGQDAATPDALPPDAGFAQDAGPFPDAAAPDAAAPDAAEPEKPLPKPFELECEVDLSGQEPSIISNNSEDLITIRKPNHYGKFYVLEVTAEREGVVFEGITKALEEGRIYLKIEVTFKAKRK